MGVRIVKLPDVGEGVAEAEVVEWHVKVGDVIQEDQTLAAVMTDKATIEIPSPYAGTVLALGAEVGSVVAVGGELVRVEVAGAADEAPAKARPQASRATAPELAVAKAPARKDDRAESDDEAAAEPPAKAPPKDETPLAPGLRRRGAPRAEGEKPLASPAVRKRARDAGVDLRQVHGTGPAGRIGHDDLEAFLRAGTSQSRGGRSASNAVETVKIIGLRRRIARKMAESKRRVAHFSYVEEIDVTALEELRTALNADKVEGRPRLTVLPFLMRALVRAIAEFPQMNALYDDEAETVDRHGGVHIGIATQTDSGLLVPVVRHVEALGLWECAAEVQRLAEATRDGSATREELSGSTITITSLGALGGIVTTPVINRPEVAIVGVNRQVVRPVWQNGQFVPRTMMNLSSSFDHRVIDGYDAARFIQRIRQLLETPATIFIED